MENIRLYMILIIKQRLLRPLRHLLRHQQRRRRFPMLNPLRKVLNFEFETSRTLSLFFSRYSHFRERIGHTLSIDRVWYFRRMCLTFTYHCEFFFFVSPFLPFPEFYSLSLSLCFINFSIYSYTFVRECRREKVPFSDGKSKWWPSIGNHQMHACAC